VLTVELDRLEARFAVADASGDDLDLYQRTAGNLRRLLESVGLERRARDVTPTLAQYLASKAAAVAQDSVCAPAATSTTIDAGERTGDALNANGGEP
jgi:hypothetical protein